MKYFVLLLAIVPIYATSDLFGDLLGQEFHHISDHVREKRQTRPLNQAPGHIKQLLQWQTAAQPLVSVPPQNVPKLNFPQPGKPQLVSQSQVTQYKPQISYSSASQQPANPQYNRPIPQVPQHPQRIQPQYRPSHQQQPIAQPNYNQPARQHGSNLPSQLQQLVQFQHNIAHAPLGKV